MTPLRRAFRALWSSALAVACGEDAGSGPSPPPGTKIAEITVTPASSSVLAGAAIQLEAVALDESGNRIPAPFAWSTSDAAVATVTPTGLVTAVGPGEVLVSARAGGQSGAAALESVDPHVIPAFLSPVEPALVGFARNYFDHDVPVEGTNLNGVHRTWWGEQGMPGLDGRAGYDWELAPGTPIRAVAAGTVEHATLEDTPEPCRELVNIPVSNSIVRIRHSLPGGVQLTTTYMHMDRIDVAPGAQVAPGQQIGLAGTRGCALTTQLHFKVTRLSQTNGPAPAPIDPYGWEPAAPDPWAIHPAGAVSIRLWRDPGQHPPLFRAAVVQPPQEVELPLVVKLTKVVFQGIHDELNPHNEVAEIALDLRFGPGADIGGYTLTTNAGLVYTFPAGTVLSAARPALRLWTATTGPTADLSRGSASPVYDNVADCVVFADAAGQRINRLGWGFGCP